SLSASGGILPLVQFPGPVDLTNYNIGVTFRPGANWSGAAAGGPFDGTAVQLYLVVMSGASPGFANSKRREIGAVAANPGGSGRAQWRTIPQHPSPLSAVVETGADTPQATAVAVQWVVTSTAKGIPVVQFGDMYIQHNDRSKAAV